MSKISDIITGIAKPIVEELGLELWDVEYVKEAGEYYLRIYIDKVDGISIEDCEAVSRAVDPILDEKDPIADGYTFEVSSAGLDRSLKRPEHFTRFIGETVEVKLYKAIDGIKVFKGKLLSYENGNVSIEFNGETLELLKEQVANVRLSLF